MNKQLQLYYNVFNANTIGSNLYEQDRFLSSIKCKDVREEIEKTLDNFLLFFKVDDRVVSIYFKSFSELKLKLEKEAIESYQEISNLYLIETQCKTKDEYIHGSRLAHQIYDYKPFIGGDKTK